MKINIIGGGAAGLYAACIAKKQGAEVCVFERKSAPGRKLKITGKGRCNITNIAPLKEFLEHFNQRGRFLRHAFNTCFQNDIIRFFESIGEPMVIERGERVFPKHQDAKRLTDAFIQYAIQLGVKIKKDVRANQFIVEDNRVIGFQTTEGKSFFGDNHILATGGKSYPATGSTGDGYQMAQKVGHQIIDLQPSLVPLETEELIPHEMNRLLLKNIRVQAFIDQAGLKPEFGELQFIPQGLSGATILTLSRQIVPALAKNKKVYIEIDLKPALDHQTLDKRLLREFSENKNTNFNKILKNILPKDLIPFCVSTTNINSETKGGQISAKERKTLRLWLKSMRFNISAHRSWAEAIVTAGGISTKEIDPKTMASKLVEGLYFAGEVMDIDADTGGFNLQAAFSTAYLAATSACHTEKR